MIDVTTTASIAVATLCRPPVNAFDLDMVESLDTAIEEAGQSATCLLIQSENPRMFSAGADIAMLRAATERTGGVDELVHFAARFQAVLDRLERAPFATVAAIDGLALGGGLELALACDFRIAGPDARMGLTETNLGLIPGAGGTQRLASTIGRARARQMVLTGRTVDATQADALGLADSSPVGAHITAHDLARDLANRPAKALALAKECLLDAPSRRGYKRELSASRALYENPETVALLTEFLNRPKRKESA